jgi:hypothetical protein
METPRTNKDLLVKGLKKMGITLVLLFLGPTLIHIAFSNQEKSLYIPILLIGILVCFLAIFMGFKGLQTIMRSIFND